jgi:probable rRNA maturation factor
MSLNIIIQNPTDRRDIPSKAEFNQWVSCALTQHSHTIQQGELTIRLVSNEESAELNQTYRNKSGPTNVLSFPYELTENSLHGDMAIAIDKVKQEAAEQKKSEFNHWAHLTIHGVLHLMGHDHIEEGEANEMEALEIKILQSIDIPNPYI